MPPAPRSQSSGCAPKAMIRTDSLCAARLPTRNKGTRHVRNKARLKAAKKKLSELIMGEFNMGKITSADHTPSPAGRDVILWLRVSREGARNPPTVEPDL